MRERIAALLTRPLFLRLVVYPTFFSFWFVVFAYATFPYDRLKEAIIAQAEAPRRSANGVTTPSNMQLTIGSLGPTFLPGLRARDVTVTFLPTRATERATTMHFDEATVHVSLFSLLASAVNGDFDATGIGGTLRGRFGIATSGPRPGLRELHAQFSGLRVGEIAPVVQAVGLPLSGRMTGSVDLAIPEGQINRSSGALRVSIEGLRIGDGAAQYQIPSFGALTVEQINAGTLSGQVDIVSGVATIREFQSRSPEFQFSMDGRIELAPVLGQSMMNAGVRFRLTDAYRTKSAQAGRIMMALDFMSTARRPDGNLAFRCSGTFDRLRCPPDTRAGAGGAGAAPALPGAGRLPALPRRGFEP